MFFYYLLFVFIPVFLHIPHFPPHVSNVCIDISDVVCSSFQCPDKYSSAEDADSTVCNDTGCTKDLCCEQDDGACTASM